MERRGFGCAFNRFYDCIRFSSVSTTTRSVAVEIGSIGERCFAQMIHVETTNRRTVIKRFCQEFNGHSPAQLRLKVLLIGQRYGIGHP